MYLDFFRKSTPNFDYTERSGMPQTGQTACMLEVLRCGCSREVYDATRQGIIDQKGRDWSRPLGSAEKKNGPRIRS